MEDIKSDKIIEERIIDGIKFIFYADVNGEWPKKTKDTDKTTVIIDVSKK